MYHNSASNKGWKRQVNRTVLLDVESPVEQVGDLKLGLSGLCSNDEIGLKGLIWSSAEIFK